MIEAVLGPDMGFQAVNFFTNLALFVLGAEIIAIIIFGRKIGLPRKYLPNAFAGFFIMLALRSHLSGLAAEWTILALFFSLLAHGGDLWVRRQLR